MRVHRDLIFGKIISYRTFYVRLLDEIGMNNGSFEIDEHAYISTYNELIVPSGDDKAVAWLSFDSMLENGIFVYNNKRSSTIALHSFVVELFRFLDVSRSRELSNADFENIRGQMQLLSDNILNSKDIDSHDYNESMVALRELVNMTISKINQNVETLDRHKNEIGEFINSREEGTAHSLSPDEIYKKIVHLYERFVVPFQEFMDPVKILRGKGVYNFWQLFDQVIKFHNNIGRQDVATELGYQKVSLTSYYKDTKRIVDDFRTYYEFMEKDRESYLAIQSAYGALLSDLDNLRHGKQVNKYLPDDAEIMRYAQPIKGLSNLRAGQAQKINWNPFTLLQYEEWKRVADEGRTKDTDVELKPLPKEIDINKARLKEISKLVFKKRIPNNIKDIHSYLHDWLSQEMEDYSLVDTLRAFETVKSLKKSRIHCHKQKGRVDDGTYYLDYLIRSI